MERKVFTLPVQMLIPKRKVDNSVKLEFITAREISTDEYIELDTYRMSNGFLLYAQNRFNDTDIPTDDAPTDLKSHSQRLRSVLYLLHKQKGGTEKDFRAFYELNMERFISKVKEQLN